MVLYQSIFGSDSPDKCQTVLRRAGVVMCIFRRARLALSGDALARRPGRTLMPRGLFGRVLGALDLLLRCRGHVLH